MAHITDLDGFKKVVRQRLQKTHKDERSALENDIVKAILESDGRCSYCRCKLIFENATRHCLYEYRLHKKELGKPMSKENLTLSCYNCSTRRQKAFKYSCINGCHKANSKEELLRCIFEIWHKSKYGSHMCTHTARYFGFDKDPRLWSHPWMCIACALDVHWMCNELGCVLNAQRT